MIKYVVLTVVLSLFIVSSLTAEIIVDSINYKIEIDDFTGSPGTIVKMPVKLKNAQALGGIIIRIEYDSSIIKPVVIDDSEPDIAFDSLEIAGRGFNTQSVTFGGDTVNNMIAYHQTDNPGTIFIRYIRPIEGAGNYIDEELGDPSVICYLFFQTQVYNPSGVISELFVKNDEGPDPDYIVVQMADTTGIDAIYPGNGPIFDSAFFTGLPGICGDLDLSGAINLLDLVYLINYLYQGGPAPNCP